MCGCPTPIVLPVNTIRAEGLHRHNIPLSSHPFICDHGKANIAYMNLTVLSQTTGYRVQAEKEGRITSWYEPSVVMCKRDLWSQEAGHIGYTAGFAPFNIQCVSAFLKLFHGLSGKGSTFAENSSFSSHRQRELKKTHI